MKSHNVSDELERQLKIQIELAKIAKEEVILGLAKLESELSNLGLSLPEGVEDAIVKMFGGITTTLLHIAERNKELLSVVLAHEHERLNQRKEKA